MPTEITSINEKKITDNCYAVSVDITIGNKKYVFNSTTFLPAEDVCELQRLLQHGEPELKVRKI